MGYYGAWVLREGSIAQSKQGGVGKRRLFIASGSEQIRGIVIFGRSTTIYRLIRLDYFETRPDR